MVVFKVSQQFKMGGKIYGPGDVIKVTGDKAESLEWQNLGKRVYKPKKHKMIESLKNQKEE